jgi:hypothetical protein
MVGTVPTLFEREVIARAIASEDDPALASQVEGLVVTKREYTVVGWYTDLAVPADAPRSTGPYADRGSLEGPCFEHPEIDLGGGSLLWFEDGRLACLELYANGDRFAEDHGVLAGPDAEQSVTWIDPPLTGQSSNSPRA